jgi:hypothetical protein
MEKTTAGVANAIHFPRRLFRSIKPRNLLMRRASLLLLATLANVWGCAAGGSGGAAKSATAPALPTHPASAPVLQELSFVRMRVGVPGDVLKVLIDSDGSYQIVRRGGGGANSSTRGKLTPQQKDRLAAILVGWNELESYYSPPGGAEEEFRFEITYGGKLIVASDAALRLPDKIRQTNRQIRELLSSVGML